MENYNLKTESNKANVMLAVRACEGNCEEHKGEVVPIIIVGGLFDGVKFNYCEEAIKEDERRGFIIRRAAND